MIPSVAPFSMPMERLSQCCPHASNFQTDASYQCFSLEAIELCMITVLIATLTKEPSGIKSTGISTSHTAGDICFAGCAVASLNSFKEIKGKFTVVSSFRQLCKQLPSIEVTDKTKFEHLWAPFTKNHATACRAGVKSKVVVAKSKSF